MADYGRWLRDAMHKAGLTQAELARGLRVHPSKVTRWLKGERAFKGNDLDRLAEYLQAPLPGRQPPAAREETGTPARMAYVIHGRAWADELAWREHSAMTTDALGKYPPRAATLHPLFGPEDQYYVPILNGLAADNPEVAAEYVICAHIEKLDRKLRPGDWVHAKLRSKRHYKDVVRKVAAEYVICAHIEKLDRKLRPGDWVHAKLHSKKHYKDVVRKVVAKDGRLVLSPLKPAPGLEDVPLSDAELEGFVLTYQQDRHF